MELFFRDLSYRATLSDVKEAFASVLHSPRYLPESQPPWNFDVYLFPPLRNQPGRDNRGIGTVTVPKLHLGQDLLRDYGGSTSLVVAGRKIKLTLSKGKPAPATVDKLNREPYISPKVYESRAATKESFQRNTVGIHTLQLGWETRSGVFSVEWEKHFQEACHLAFSDNRREMRIRILDQQDVVRSIAIHWSQISWSATGYGDEGHPQNLIQSHLNFRSSTLEKRQRLLFLYPDDADFIRVLPYATLSIRLLCRSIVDLKIYKELCKIARLPTPKDFTFHANHLGLFSAVMLEQYHQWITSLDWSVAFQLEALLRGRLADTKEVLSIRGIIDNMTASKGASHTADFLRSVVNNTVFEIQGHHEGAFKASVERHAQNFSWPSLSYPWDPKDGVLSCLHVSISPTSMKLGGPFPERSNRVMRTYTANHDSFIRVSFVEENDLRYQHDREIDGPAFIGKWVSPTLRDGFAIAGKRFRFLAYSQSALKSHTVWFVKDFSDPNGDLITAATIIAGLGKFDGLEYDRKLIYCPARYAARISQAFTTTDSSISIQAEEIILREDIERDKYCFTEGVGSISPQLARKIWRALQQRGSRATRRAITYPRAFQIRLVGAKGMLSVDPSLSGDVVELRPSMIKFDAPHSTNVEIAQAFVRPSKYYLNRPLIMILEGLGIPYSVFKTLQDTAVQDAYDAATSLEKAANTLDQFGLGASYRLSSTLLHLAKLGISPEIMGGFYNQMLEFSIHHILRDLKHHARIPVNDGYTLVGVADIHHYLQEGEVFACVTIQETNSIRYLDGPVLISRSPTIHPGDVQVVRAIGRPPPGSIFAREPLMNTVVFSVEGTRPLPSCLGGGDLDGDVYNITFLKDLHPEQNMPPAAYDPAPKKLLDRPSTMNDVADFVADYINSDILGLVAINWLLIADLHDIFHDDCIKLCRIHSNAVDYPKSGTPVTLNTVPKPKSERKPDWNAPETVDLDASHDFYQSQKAIGRLFRAIDLSDVQIHNSAARQQRRRLRDDPLEADLDEVFAALCIGDQQGDPLELAVENRVAQFINTDPHSKFVALAIDSLERYSMELQGICACNALQRHKDAMLSEEEAVIGTIVAKCSQRRRRREAMAQLREQTNYLVRSVRDELAGDDETSQLDWLATAWAAWKVSQHLKYKFGANSYGWIALGEVFDAMKAIEQEMSSSRR
ncbi:RdRP-domain-containing protein [Multifurca ochricompacta]|uniref:RNA-dependent RNA polymerase n=1 Tax=Multifurca ochricompacta TaxID=376703 RepID=A0AAD4MFX4_9AGAM|nr:RdRP-domain-containing protein [Multifurca ochricompacta]